MDIVIRSEDCTEVWNGILYKKLSDYPRVSRWELKTLAEFAAYEKAQGRECTLHCEDEPLKAAILEAMAHPEKYRDTPRPALITECTACPVRKGCETAFVCHTTSPENARSIFRCGKLLSAVRARGIPAEELARESRNAANDPTDYFDYVMFTWGNCQGGDRLVTERRLGRFPDESDLSDGFEPGVRFYFRYDDLKTHPGVTFDGVLPMKVRDEVALTDYAYAIIIPETLRKEMKECIPAELSDKVIYVKNDCADIWEWSEKVYRTIETKCVGE